MLGLIAAMAFQLLASALPVAASVAPLAHDSVAALAAPIGGSWGGSGLGAINTVHDGTDGLAQFTYNLNPAGFSTQSWTFETTADTTGPLRLSWAYSGFHAYFQVRVDLHLVVIRASTTVDDQTLVHAGPVNCCASPSAGFNYSGWTTIDVQPGDTIRFLLSGSNDDSNNQLQGTLTVTPGPLFVAQSPVATGGGSCSAPDYNTIAAAVGAASNHGTIHICAGTYSLNSTIDVPVDLTLEGDGATTTILDGGDDGHPFQIIDSTGQDLTIRGLTFQSGYSSGNGGAIVASALDISGSVFQDNSAASLSGGALFAGDITIADSTFSDNLGSAVWATGALSVTGSTFTNNVTTAHAGPSDATCGGAIVAQASATIATSTFTGNQAGNCGGAIYGGLAASIAVTDSTFDSNEAGTERSDGNGGAIDALTVTATGSTFKGNSVPNAGGAINARTNLTATNDTFSGNNAATNGGAVAAAAGSIKNSTFDANTSPGGASISAGAAPTITNTILAKADDASPNCQGPDPTDLGGNFSTDSSCDFGVGHDGVSSAGLHLDTLADNGGPTETIALLAGSIALNAAVPTCPATDQRGVARPQGAACDSGSYESDESPVSVNAPSLLGVMPVGSDTLYSGLLTGTAGTAYDVDFYSTTECPGGTYGSAPLTHFGAQITVITDANGTGVFNNGFSGVTPSGLFAVARVTAPGGGLSAFSNCVVVGPANDIWPRATTISGNATGFIDQPGQQRWYKFAIQPGTQVTATLSGLPADYDLALFTDIGQAYNNLVAPASTQELTKLGAEFAGTAFSGTAFSGTAFSGTAFSGTAFSGTAFSGTAFSGTAFSGTAFSGTAFSGTAFSGTAFSGTAFSGTAFSGTAFSPDAFSNAVSRSVIVASGNPGTADESVAANTWSNTGYFYVGVLGKNGASDFDHPFTLTVTQTSGQCGGVFPITSPASPAALGPDYRTIILTDSGISTDPGRLPATVPTDRAALATNLTAFAARTDVRGAIVDLHNDPRIRALNLQADAHPGCVYAKNLVADGIRDIVSAYRAANATMAYVVLIGSDDVIPFFRYPDRSDIGQESAFVPPVVDNSASQASLRENYVLSQDAYGAGIQISLYASSFPIPDLPVGRLVETASEVTGMLDAYIATNGVVSPGSSLVTGYDFMADAAQTAQDDLSAGTGGLHSDSLIAPNDVAPTDPSVWTATQLKSQFLGTRHDIVFLAGHFSANAALAADFKTAMTTSDLTAAPLDMTNVIVLSIGCHSGYNIVDGAAVPNVTQPLDWAQAFARKKMTGILGTGYQYGDTDFEAYSERLYTDVAHRLRIGSGPVTIGQALVGAKLDYLRDTPDIRGLHEKALREATLFGLPMLGVNLPAGRGLLDHPADATISTPSGYLSGPGNVLGLQTAILDVTPSLTPHTKTLNVDGGGTIGTTYYSGPDGILTNPGEPAIPLDAEGVGLNGSVLRGVGFLGGDYQDLTVVPLSGAPGTEVNGVHTAFTSPTFFPSKMWTPNYYDSLTPGGAGTRLLLTPAQHQAPNPGDPNVTLRKYDNLHLKLFYSSSLANGAGSDAPTITFVDAVVDGQDVHFSAHVVGDPRAGVQEAWVTYTGLGSSWQSLDLVQDATDSSLWTGTLHIAALPATVTELDFMVQAANGFGLVGLNDNLGAYHKAFIAPIGVVVPPPNASSLDFTAPTTASGAFGTTAQFSAKLSPTIAGETLKFTLGGVSRYGLTNGSGIATVDFPLNLDPGSHPVAASFAGDAAALPSSASTSVSITQIATQLAVASPAGGAPYGGESGVTATLTAGGSPLASRTVVIALTGPGGSLTTTAITDPSGVAHLGTLTLPVGTYAITANFAADANYEAAPQATGNLTINRAPGSVSINNIPLSPANGGSFVPAYTKLGDGLVSTTSSTISVCKLVGTTVSFVGVGTCSLTAHVAAGTNNLAADGSVQSFAVGKGNQTIVFTSTPPAAPVYGGTYSPVTATGGGSGNAVVLTASGACSISGSSVKTVTFTIAGLCTVTANQAGNSLYNAAIPVSQLITVGKKTATLGYTGTLFWSAGSGTSTSVTFTGKVTPAAGGTVDLTKATVDFVYYSSATPLVQAGDCLGTVSSAGVATCSKSLGLDNWTVVMTIPTANNYFTAPAPSDPIVLTVYQASAGKYATGAGYIIDPSVGTMLVKVLPSKNHGSFGFAVSYKTGTTPQGVSVYEFRATDGNDYYITTTSWTGGGLSFGTGTASFSSKCSVTVVNPATHKVVAGLGGANFTCRYDVTDGPTDKLALSVYNSAGVLYHQAGTAASQISLGAGSIVVKK